MNNASRLGPSSWGGGWSNRAALATVGFTYGTGLLSSGSGTEDEMKKDGEEDEIEVVEQIPPDMTEDVEDVQVLTIDSMDETDHTA